MAQLPPTQKIQTQHQQQFTKLTRIYTPVMDVLFTSKPASMESRNKFKQYASSPGSKTSTKLASKSATQPIANLAKQFPNKASLPQPLQKQLTALIVKQKNRVSSEGKELPPRPNTDLVMLKDTTQLQT